MGQNVCRMFKIAPHAEQVFFKGAPHSLQNCSDGDTGCIQLGQRISVAPVGGGVGETGGAGVSKGGGVYEGWLFEP